MANFEWTPPRIAAALAAGDDLSALDGHGRTAMHRAWDADCMARIVATGISVDVLDSMGRTALGAAAESIGALGDGLVRVGRLIDLGANIEAAQSTTAERDRYLLHATTRHEWDEARSQTHYRPARFAEEGFTHCSSALQVGRTLDRLFRGHSNIVLLVVMRRALDQDTLIWENLEGGAERFPHVYGPMPVRCVTGVVSVPLRDDGSFDLGSARTRPAG